MQQPWTVSHHFYDIYNNKQEDTKVKYWKRTGKTRPFPFSPLILPAGGLIKDTREEKQTKMSPLRHNFKHVPSGPNPLRADMFQFFLVL